MRLAAFVVLVAVVSCRSKPKPSTDPVMNPPLPGSMDPVLELRRVESFRPARGDSAIRAFVPDVAPVDSGGECNVSKPFGSSVTFVTAYFPSLDSARTNVGLTFDSAGKLVRFYDRRGSVRVRYPRGATAAQRDSIAAAAEGRLRSTQISFDWPVDQAIARNSGGGKPTVAVIGTIRSMENVAALGPPTQRIQRVRRLCGV